MSHPESAHKLRRSLAGLSVLALVGASFAVPALAADGSATTNLINPFDVNNGFGFVSSTDATFNNSEVEGSVAVFGTIAAAK
jgi:hypothetical protein